MSKGFAHTHSDAVHPLFDRPDKTNPIRTELRSMRINLNQLLTETFPHFIDDIASFHLIGGALASQNQGLQSIWREFREAIDNEVAKLPAPFKTFLDADWFESTGDSSDGRLMPLLDIVQKRRSVVQWVREQGAADQLRQTFRDIRNSHARKVFETLPSHSIYTNHPEHFETSPGGLLFLNPLRGAAK